VCPLFSIPCEPSPGIHDSTDVNTGTTTSDPHADELLAIRCQLGERVAFDALFARWHEPLWRYLRRLAGNDDAARDLVQETWLRILRGIASLREPAKVRPWLFGIARRVAMDRLRLAYARPLVDEVDLDQLAAPEPDLALDSDFASLEAGLARLPTPEREALTLFYLRELTIEEIAELLGAPAGTIKSRLFRARQTMRRELSIEGDTP
jgi:RNA polymerase sigma factor (sigma-70 family)